MNVYAPWNKSTFPNSASPSASPVPDEISTLLALQHASQQFRQALPFERGSQVLVLGATGSSGFMAVQIARHLGAARVIAAGRNAERLTALRALGATDTVALTDDALSTLARKVDVVLDFVWGEPSVRVMESVLRHRSNRSQPLTWIHIGGMAGDVAPIPGAFLRAAKTLLLGSGHGSVTGREIFRELPELVREIGAGTFHFDVRRLPLSDVERAWQDDSGSDGRIVFTP